jgi:hypothetical protein
MGRNRRPARRALIVAAALAVAGGPLLLASLAAPAAASGLVTPTPSLCDTTWVPKASSVIVFPPPGTLTANPRTQVSIRGTPLGKFGPIDVVGSRSGTHGGVWRADSDGRGASFYPSRPFDPGETVTVRTRLHVVNGYQGRWTFRVSDPAAAPGDLTVTSTDSGPGVFSPHSRPIHPAIVTVADPNGRTPAPGYFFLAPKPGFGMGIGIPGPMIVDNRGKLVWYRPVGDSQEAFDFRPQTYQGQPVLTWWQGRVTDLYYGTGTGLIVNDKYQTIATVHAGDGYSTDLHEFQITPENTALLLAYQPVHFRAGRFDGVAVDSIVQEIDIPTGNVLFEWHSLDHVWLRDSVMPYTTDDYDYFHVNSADLDARNDGILISARGTDSEYFVSRYTGQIQWRLSGKKSSMGGTVETIGQHDVKWLGPNSISIFDDGSTGSGSSESHSRGLVVGLDCVNHRASYVKRYSPAGGGLATSQGSMQLLPDAAGRLSTADSDAVLGMGSENTFYELAPAGATVLAGSLPASSGSEDQSYRVFKDGWRGYPTTPPLARAVANSGGGLTAYVTWNGNTQVDKWRISGAASCSAATWTDRDTVPKSGYETRISEPWSDGCVRITALDRGGNPIAGGTSAKTPVG